MTPNRHHLILTSALAAVMLLWAHGSVLAAPTVSSTTSEEEPTLAGILAIAFLAGLILNVMPCVLPVIGLKIMSFVQQAGESRQRIFVLNLWYTLGLMSVFMVLATLVVVLKFGWAEQFQSVGFNISLASVVFVFGLSLLGVWEIPIPGFVGTSGANQLAAREGYVGAFLKGVLATVLATPCTGPFLVPATAWAFNQSAVTNYTVFASIGLGMASPYLMIGLFPALIRLLPKPGVWMETFKQLMGFVLMATVVWIVFFIDDTYRIQTLALFVGLALACWLAGRTPLTAALKRRLKTWTISLVVVVVSAVCIFYVAPRMTPNELAWKPFTRAVLDEHRKQGHTVLIDFTAKW